MLGKMRQYRLERDCVRIRWGKGLGSGDESRTACSEVEMLSESAEVTDDTTTATTFFLFFSSEVWPATIPPIFGALSDGWSRRTARAWASSDHLVWSSKSPRFSSRIDVNAPPTYAPAAVTPAMTRRLAPSKSCCGLGVRRNAPCIRAMKPGSYGWSSGPAPRAPSRV